MRAVRPAALNLKNLMLVRYQGQVAGFVGATRYGLSPQLEDLSSPMSTVGASAPSADGRSRCAGSPATAPGAYPKTTDAS